MNNIAINIDQVSKVYQLYQKHSDRVLEVFHPFRKKYYHPFTALNGISCQIRKGEAVGIIGRNGSGKSTLLQIICGILVPTAGNITVNGRVSALLELGAGFNPEFTGDENIYLNSSILGFNREETDLRYDDIVSFADIGEFIHQPVKTYSSGMYIRLAFAIAVHVNPEILIVDEALAVGDIFFQQKCIQHMKNLMKGCTKVIVTHDMRAVANMCDRVIVLDRGNKVFEGSPLKGIEHYTKIMHNEVFEPADYIEESASAPIQPGPFEDVGWTDVPESSRAGASEITIEKVKITTRENEPVLVAKAGDDLVLHFYIHSTSSKESIIFGYTVKDRVGNAIFGENTCDGKNGPVEVQPGFHHVQLAIKWPEIYPAEYTITLGVGEGDHPLSHTIQCWAHNILSITSISPGKSIHALFNNPIQSAAIYPIE